MESCDAAKLLRSFRNLHFELCQLSLFFLLMLNWKKELFAAWNQVPWPCKGRSKTTTGYMDGLSNQEKMLKIIPSHIRKTAAGF